MKFLLNLPLLLLLLTASNNANAQKAKKCDTTDDCDELQFCSAGECRDQGTCDTNEDCKNPKNVYAVIECVGPLQCFDDGLCGRSCGPTSCINGEPETPCGPPDSDGDPCLDFKFGCPMAESCVPDICGGSCSAIFFDPQGNVLEDCSIVEPPVPENPIEGTSINNSTTVCESDLDCQDEMEYCADGTCLTYGECHTRIDCFNPANSPYAVPACVGLLDCNDDGEGTLRCGMTCGDQECPGGEARVECPAMDQCNITNCDDDGVVSCNFDGCGGECTEIFFNEMGQQVCNGEGEHAGTTCSSDADCNDDSATAVERQLDGTYYCAQGVCMEKGTCNDLLDCQNPSNIYPALDCVGYTTCTSGKCAIECGPACPDGGDWTVCEVAPCEDTTCAAATSCANHVCNGCHAIFFDAAGNKVDQCDDVATFNNNMGGSGAIQTTVIWVAASLISTTVLGLLLA